MTFPSVASIVQRKLGAPTCIAFDVQAVCSGFVYALSVADGFVARGLAKCALVIGAEEMTRLMDWTDRSTCVLFGDGAGCVVVEPREGQGTKADQGLLGFALRCDGTKTDLLYVDGGPATTGTVGHLRMAGNQVFRHAVVNIAEAITAACVPPASRSPMSTGSCRTRPTSASSRVSATGWVWTSTRSSQTVADPREHLGGLDSRWPGPKAWPTGGSRRATCC
jgi:hypothetical protein